VSLLDKSPAWELAMPTIGITNGQCILAIKQLDCCILEVCFAGCLARSNRYLMKWAYSMNNPTTIKAGPKRNLTSFRILACCSGG
jgi:hypothetical protein